MVSPWIRELLGVARLWTPLDVPRAGPSTASCTASTDLACAPASMRGGTTGSHTGGRYGGYAQASGHASATTDNIALTASSIDRMSSDIAYNAPPRW